MARPAHPLARRWLTLDGLRLHYREGGRAGDRLPPVVMVHGLVVSSRYLLPTAALLAPHLRVLVPDLPGFGRSEGPRPALDVAGLAAHLGRWLDALAVEAPLLVANSLGCQVVAELAAGSPRRWHGIVLTGPTVDRTRRTLPAQALRLLVDTLREPPKLAWISSQ